MKPTDEEVERLARAAREAEIARGIRHSKPWYPDDDPRWQEFTPGDPMPCDPDMKVEILIRREREGKYWYSCILTAENLRWDAEVSLDRQIVAWRPA